MLLSRGTAESYLRGTPGPSLRYTNIGPVPKQSIIHGRSRGRGCPLGFQRVVARPIPSSQNQLSTEFLQGERPSKNSMIGFLVHTLPTSIRCDWIGKFLVTCDRSNLLLSECDGAHSSITVSRRRLAVPLAALITALFRSHTPDPRLWLMRRFATRTSAYNEFVETYVQTPKSSA